MLNTVVACSAVSLEVLIVYVFNFLLILDTYKQVLLHTVKIQ